MKMTVNIVETAGSRTAIVRQGFPKQKRREAVEKIMADPDLRAGQVGFESRPLHGGVLGRIEMAGGEFCANAVRAYGYLLCKEREIDHCKVESSGTREQLEIICDLERSTSAAQMPMPENMEMAGPDADHLYPLVTARGYSHVLCPDTGADEETVKKLFECVGAPYGFFGIHFFDEESLTPYVYSVHDGSVTKFPSCGTGSLAAAWYMSLNKPDGFHVFTLQEPGGELIVRIAKRQGRFAGTVGGTVTVEDPKELGL